MYLDERDAYSEAYLGPPGCIIWLLGLGWALVTIAGFVWGEQLGEAVEALVSPAAASCLQRVSFEGRVEAGSEAYYLATIAGGVVAGTVLGIAQGLYLWPFFKLAGTLEWIAATIMGRTVRWVIMFILARELATAVFDREALGGPFFLFAMALLGLVVGLPLGYTQSKVLDRRMHHSTWWVWTYVPGTVGTAILIGLVLYFEWQNYLRDYATLIAAIITGAVTAIAMMDLMRHPHSGAEWVHLLHLRRPRRVGPGPDTVLGSSLYGPSPQAPTGNLPDQGDPR
jgi:hypothetical protein